ncbi:unnamed protein product [Thelazia callipaeda]|uniref:Uncharacterized protein n=1 Tax=Thelazia callipaeda TaxID=103827 RepID=A0A3P7KLW0_THECL|nr:unnamed protein product [Thelazia callipaeda]
MCLPCSIRDATKSAQHHLPVEVVVVHRVFRGAHQVAACQSAQVVRIQPGILEAEVTINFTLLRILSLFHELLNLCEA